MQLGRRAWKRFRIGLKKVGIEVHRYPPSGPAKFSLEHKLRVLFERSAIDFVVDVGAHWGEFAQSLRDPVRFEGPIVSFEPDDESFARLTANLRGDELWTGHRSAVGAETGTAQLNVFASTNLNSFREQTALGEDLLAMRVADVRTVPVTRLDQVALPPGKFLLKTDTQGHDLAVIEGAGGVLDRALAILIEIPIRNLYDDAPTLDTIVPALTRHGFELAGLYPVLLGEDGVSVVEFDGLFVRSSGT